MSFGEKSFSIKDITIGDNKAISDVPYITPYKSIMYHVSKAYHIN